MILLFFFFNDTATTEIYTLSLHDALPISIEKPRRLLFGELLESRVDARFDRTGTQDLGAEAVNGADGDRKSTRLNSSHQIISYAVFCLKKKTSMSLLRSDASPDPRLRGCR